MIYLEIGDFKSDVFIRFCGEYQILIVLFRDFDFLLIGGHDSIPRGPVNIYFGEINFKEQRLLAFCKKGNLTRGLSASRLYSPACLFS